MKGKETFKCTAIGSYILEDELPKKMIDNNIKRLVIADFLKKINIMLSETSFYVGCEEALQLFNNRFNVDMDIKVFNESETERGAYYPLKLQEEQENLLVGLSSSFVTNGNGLISHVRDVFGGVMPKITIYVRKKSCCGRIFFAYTVTDEFRGCRW